MGIPIKLNWKNLQGYIKYDHFLFLNCIQKEHYPGVVVASATWEAEAGKQLKSTIKNNTKEVPPPNKTKQSKNKIKK